MSKKIVVLETSVTMQKLFANTLSSEDYTLSFETDGKAAVYKLFDIVPDLLLINTDVQNPPCFEVVRLVRSIPCFSHLAIGLYATIPSLFDEHFAKDYGVNLFVNIEQKTAELNIEELAQIPAERLDKPVVAQAKKTFDDTYLFKKSVALLHGDSFKRAIALDMLNLLEQFESIETLAREFLLLIADVCEVPLVSLYILENDGPHGYYVCAQNVNSQVIADFLSVSAADFEKIQSDYNASKINAKMLSQKESLNRFYNEDRQLSSYETGILKNGKNEFGSVQIVSEGNITSSRLDLFLYCVQNAAVLFEKSVIMKKKMFFEKNIRRAFSRFVPEQIIDDLVSAADTSGDNVAVGEKRPIAILFSDIRSFTSISEINKPEVMVAFLNRYFTLMVNAIKKHGGTIDKFIGDAIMALFGAPISYEDNSRRAVAAAYEMRELLPTVPLGDLVLPEGMTFNIGIGIHYWDVTVGSIGSSDKTDYTVIGDSVNLASRLEGLTKTYGTQVLVSESVREDTIKSAGEDAFYFRHLDDVRVKGKAKAVPIFAVDRNKEEFSEVYKDSYAKGMDLYKQGIFNLAYDYFQKALVEEPNDKAAKLMLSRCEDFIKNPPEHWDGAIAFNTK